MPVSPARSPLRRSAATLATAIALVGALVGPASAQVGPPVRLAPADLSDKIGATPPAAAGGPLHPLAPPGIIVDQLPPPSADGLGALGPNERPLPATLWQGTSRAAAEALIPRIKPSTAPTLQDLAYRLLASPATPPEGDKPDAGALLAFRAERLTALGRADSALALLQSAPPAGTGEDVTRVIVDLAFLSGDTRTACATARARDTAWQGAYWDQATVTCLALDGQADQAQLGLDLLREAKVKDDGFSALVLKAVGIDAKLPDLLPSPQTMSLVLLQKAGQPLPKKALDAAPLAIQRTVAQGAGFPADQRLAAAEKAAAYGAIAPERLAEAYLATELTDEDRQSPLNRAKAAGGARGRAILFQAAHDAGQLTAKANFLLAYLGDAKSDLFPALARAAAPMLIEVPASEDLKPVAADFARALYALDQPRQAAAWFEIAAPETQAGLLPLAHVVAGDAAPPWAGEALADLAGGKKDATAPRRAAAAALLLTAEGVSLPDRMLLPLADANAASLSSPPVGPASLLANAVAAKRLGGTLLALFAAAGDQGLAAQPVLAAQAVAALRQVGLPDEARHLAIDIAVAEGI
ncbi:MAG: putative Antifreeze glycopeptide polyprotein [Rhodospirillales bacterium]|nr:putative Antifreeze glycopeptide polyprotein [Rhodospirillales bacterium]